MLINKMNKKIQMNKIINIKVQEIIKIIIIKMIKKKKNKMKKKIIIKNLKHHKNIKLPITIIV